MHGPDGPGASPDPTPRPATRRALAVAGAIAVAPVAAIAVLYTAVLMILLPFVWQVGIAVIGAVSIRTVLQSRSAMATLRVTPALSVMTDISGAALRSELRAVDSEAELNRRLAVLFPGLDVTERRSAFLGLSQDIQRLVPTNQCRRLPPSRFTGAAGHLVDQYPFALVRYQILSGSAYLIVVKLGRTPRAPDLGAVVRVNREQAGGPPVLCVVLALGWASPPW